MNEQAPQPDPLSERILYDRSLRDWHTFLLTDQQTGEVRDDAVPCSRYGTRASQCAWWAIAAEVAFEQMGGDQSDYPESGITYLMGAAVNDSADIREVVLGSWEDLPYALKEQLVDYDLLMGEQ